MLIDTHSALEGVGSYCISKSALYMFYLCWNQDLKGQVLVGSFDPGIVGTSMQNRLRTADEKEFASQAMFHEIEESGLLQDPMRVAQFIRQVFLETSDNEFVQAEFKA